MDDLSERSGSQDPEPANLRFLRRLVTTLTATMILGVLIVITLLVIRLQRTAPVIALPDAIALPDGVAARAFTRGPDWYAIVTDQNEILIYDAASATLRQRIEIESGPPAGR